MKMNTLKSAFGLALATMLLIGCTSTDTADEEEAAREAAERDRARAEAAERDRVRGGGEDDDEQEELDTVVYFDFDQAVLKPDTRATLLGHADRLKADPTSVRLEGHTDERGTREYNMALGERRAEAVRDFLVLQGVDRDILEVISYGEERPAAQGSNERAWSQNRRVEIEY